MQKAQSKGLEALPLHPEEAKVGVELRLLGNDSGKKLTIGRAEISRLDHNAPDLGPDSSVDFNVNYISATFSAAGGSSGSPAVNKKGQVVALQSAGLNNASIDLLLPLDLCVKAIERLREKKPVTRGTLQVKWSLLGLNECQRYNLPAKWEDKIRKEDRTNAIRADVVLPEGPADGQIEIGNILLELDGELITDLIPLELHMDDNVDKPIHLKLWRMNQEVHADCRIGDLHDIVPGHFFSRSGTVFHTLAYQRAIKKSIPVRGVYVSGSSSSAAFLPGNIIESIDNKPTPDLDQLMKVLNGYGDGGFIETCHKAPNDIKTPIIRNEYLPADRSLEPNHMHRQPREGGPWARVDGQAKPSG